MCGIAGYSSGLDTHTKWLRHSLAVLDHRGPDDRGCFEDLSQRVGLSHTRLSIQDTSNTGHQPMSSPDGQVVLVFNGEIYNFQELRNDLLQNGYSFRGASDTEVLLYLYLDWSLHQRNLSDLLSTLNGIFSFAIWDSRCSSLLVARDSFGVKPLYFYVDGSSFAFASEIKALYTFNQLHRQVDPVAVDQYLTYLWSPGERTPFDNIKKLPPGEFFWVQSGSIVNRTKWHSLPLGSSVIQYPDQSSSIRELQRNLRQAVTRQMISDVPVGAFLSGGLDSSSIVAFAREVAPELRCFTIDLTSQCRDGFTDDLPFARRVARHLGTSLDVVEVDAASMASSVEEMVWQLDEPLADPAALNLLYISRFARDRGIKVLLSGAGGDDLFTGYRRHLAVSCERYWGWLPKQLRIQAQRFTGCLPLAYPLARRIKKAFAGAHLDSDERLINYFRWIDRSDLFNLYTPAFRAALRLSQNEDPMMAFLEDLPSRVPPLERMLLLEQRFFLSDHNLNYSDKMSMAVGVEVRVPFLDADLLDCAARIPLRFKQRRRQGKWILKKAMEPYLPHDVIYRPKTGFGTPLRHWLRFELSDWLADILSSDALHRRGIFDSKSVHRLIALNSAGQVDASYTLFSLACIEIWCRRFIDISPTSSPLAHS